MSLKKYEKIDNVITKYIVYMIKSDLHILENRVLLYR